MYYKELDVLESKHNGTCFSGKFLCVGETISKDLVVKCPVCSEDPELFADGYTETCHPNNLQIIIDTYESFGGVLIS